MNAAVGLAAMGVARQLPLKFRGSFDAAAALYRGRATLNTDEPAQQIAAGRFFYLSGYTDDAIAAFRTALALNPAVPAKYELARALAEKGDSAEARQILSNIPANDSQHVPAQQLLAMLEANQQNTNPAGAGPNSTGADARFHEGLLAYQNQNYGVALKDFDDALAASPQAAWAQRARIDRAICLARLSRTGEAEAAMQTLSGAEEARKDLDFQLAYVELLYDTARAQEALKRVDAFIAMVPNAPTAHLWRARALLELQRVNEAVVSAEEALKLQPELVATHNLLIRIYQMQGRAKEAAQQAEWLREYQRRTELH
jgi:tetratricopeptide (TPR) repeat protein